MGFFLFVFVIVGIFFVWSFFVSEGVVTEIRAFGDYRMRFYRIWRLWLL